MTIHFEFISCEISSIVMMVFSIGKSLLALPVTHNSKKMLLQHATEARVTIINAFVNLLKRMHPSFEQCVVGTVDAVFCNFTCIHCY